MLFRMRVQPQDRRAFTAIELIIVVIIIGVLASAGMSRYKNFTVQARKNSCISNQEQIASAIRLVENDLGPLSSDSVMRLSASGVIDHISLAGGSDNFNIWVSKVPQSWTATNTSGTTSNNDKVLNKAGDTRVFRCPEDSNLLTPTYAGISNFPAANGAVTQSSDTRTYTFAKNVTSNRGTFTGGVPIVSTDPLEGYNWLTNSIEWKNTSFAFCRRWGLRNPSATGFSAAPVSQASLNGTSTDLLRYVPGGQEVRLAHSSYAPTQ